MQRPPNSPARLPNSPRHSSQSSDPPKPKDKEELANVRNAANFRTVQRNEPSLSEILDTTAYAVIYHWGNDKWEKQKQEGSLFVIKRTKSPEYALFMLNRQAVKNVLIPLVPGEMKATVIDASMLQVARRGEKIRYGIWFTDASDVPRFRDTIVRICGEPTKKPTPAAGAPATAPPGATGAAPFRAPEHSVAPFKPVEEQDGLSRLFAGLTTVPAPGSSPQPQPPQAQPQQASTSVPSDPAIYHGAPQGQVQGAQGAKGTPPPPSNFAPGQTVDDLLRGILGPPVPPAQAASPAHAPPQAPTQLPPPTQAPVQARQQQHFSPAPSSPLPPNGSYGPPPPGAPSNGYFQGPPGAPPGMPGGGIPTPVVLRDALADTLPPLRDRAQMTEALGQLLREERFVDDVWRAYCARTGRAP